MPYVMAGKIVHAEMVARSTGHRREEIGATTPTEEESNQDEERDDDGEPTKDIDLTHADSYKEEPVEGTRDCILQNCKVGQRVAWPTDARRVTIMLNPDKIIAEIPGIQEEKCGCEKRYEIETCPKAAV